MKLLSLAMRKVICLLQLQSKTQIGLSGQSVRYISTFPVLLKACSFLLSDFLMAFT